LVRSPPDPSAAIRPCRLRAADRSPRPQRRTSTSLPGAIYFLDRDYRTSATLPLPGPPTEIRRIDGRDLSLSNHVRDLGLEVRWPD
jgi:hypothetical protein